MPHTRLRIRSAALLFLALLATPTPGAAQDILVEGCNELLAGEIGVASLAGSVGQQLSLPVTVNADSEIHAFVLQVDLPPGLLSYVRTDRGTLTTGFQQLGGNFFAGPDRVRIVGLDSGVGIPPGAAGTLAVLVFQVVAPGTGAFGTSALQDDLAAYSSCEDLHGTSAVSVGTWGRTKAAYR
jgi:hypothetical protein